MTKISRRLYPHHFPKLRSSAAERSLAGTRQAVRDGAVIPQWENDVNYCLGDCAVAAAEVVKNRWRALPQYENSDQKNVNRKLAGVHLHCAPLQLLTAAR
jgi:hypothetical protein